MDMREQIVQAAQVLAPIHLDVRDESHLHSRGKQSHYKAVIVSAQFSDLALLRRHQLVYTTLSDLMPRFHALALHTYTPEEWAKQGDVPASPTCRGGSKHDPV